MAIPALASAASPATATTSVRRTDVIVVAPGDAMLLTVGPALDDRYRLKSCERLEELPSQLNPQRLTVILVHEDAVPGGVSELNSMLADRPGIAAIACVRASGRRAWDEACSTGLISSVLDAGEQDGIAFATAIEAAAARATLQEPRTLPNSAKQTTPRRSVPVVGFSLVIIALAAVLAWWFFFHRGADLVPSRTGSAPTATATVDAPASETLSTRRLLSDARRAFAEQRYFEPADSSALSLWHQVLAREASNEEAIDGMRRLESVLISRAEAALGAGRLDEASRAITALQTNWPGSAKLAELTEKVGHERGRIAAQQATEAIDAGAYDKARHLIDSLGALAEFAPVAATLRQSLEEKLKQDRLKATEEARQRELTAHREAQAAAEAKEREAAARRAAAAAPSPAEQSDLAKAAEAKTTSPAAAADALVTLKPTYRVSPDYPEVFLAQRLTGAVVLQLTVDARGHVKDMQVVSSDLPGAFAQSAMAAVRSWHFEPYLVNNTPAPATTRIRISFKGVDGLKH
jgi:TonB family protein